MEEKMKEQMEVQTEKPEEVQTDTVEERNTEPVKETSAEPAEETGAEIMEEINAESEPVSNVKICTGCGAELGENEVFCSQCGTKYGTALDQNVETNMNQPDTKQKKRKNKLIIAVSIIVAAIVITGIIVAVKYNYYKGTADSIVDNLKKENYDVVVSDYEKLGMIGEKLFREDVVDEFVNTVKNNKYSLGTDSNVANGDSIEKYEKLKTVCKAMEITSKDDTNVKEYIDAVLNLKQYVKYNELVACIMASKDNLTKSFDYISEASDSTYLRTTYLKLSYDSALSAITSASKYNSQEFRVSEYVDLLKNYKNALFGLAYGTITSARTSECSKYISEIGDMVDDVSSILKSAKEMQDNLPQLK